MDAVGVSSTWDSFAKDTGTLAPEPPQPDMEVGGEIVSLFLNHVRKQ